LQKRKRRREGGEGKRQRAKEPTNVWRIRERLREIDGETD
jgi:hypothetical protein